MSFKRPISRQLPPHSVGSSQGPYTIVGDWVTDTDALNGAASAERLYSATVPATDVGMGVLVIELDPHIRTTLKFAGYAAGDPSGLYAALRGWFMDELVLPQSRAPQGNENNTEAVGTHAFDIDVAAGSTTIPDTAKLHPGGSNIANWCDAITINVDETYGQGLQTNGTVAGTSLELTLDAGSHRWLLIEVQCVDLEGFLVLKRAW